MSGKWSSRGRGKQQYRVNGPAKVDGVSVARSRRSAVSGSLFSRSFGGQQCQVSGPQEVEEVSLVR